MCSILRAEDGGGGTGLTTVSTNMARHNPCFMDIARNSPAAKIAARLMPLDEVRYFYNQSFIKDPGTQDIDLQVGKLPVNDDIFPIASHPCDSSARALFRGHREGLGDHVVVGQHRREQAEGRIVLFRLDHGVEQLPALNRSLVQLHGQLRQLRHAFCLQTLILKFQQYTVFAEGVLRRFVDLIVQFIVVEPEITGEAPNVVGSVIGFRRDDMDRAHHEMVFCAVRAHRVKCGLSHIEPRRHVNRDLLAVDGFVIALREREEGRWIDIRHFTMGADHPVIDHLRHDGRICHRIISNGVLMDISLV